MSYTWSSGAVAVLEHVGNDWGGVWSLLFTATKATFRLSLQLPLDLGAELAYAAMDSGEARDEVGWAHPDVPRTTIAVDLGPALPGAGHDLPATCAVIVDLLDGALQRLPLLAASDAADQELARRVGSRVCAARDFLTTVQL